MLLGLSLFIIFKAFFDKHIYNLKFKKFLDFTDKYSYDIYLVHNVFILGCFSVLPYAENKIIQILNVMVWTVLFAIIVKKLSDTIKKCRIQMQN